jgi:outer membrane protein TolC
MIRSVSYACLSLIICAGAGRAAAPPVVPTVRPISLAEAAKCALEAEGFSVGRSDGGSLRVSPPRRLGSLEALRLANQRLLNVEVAYWNLYQARKALSARKKAVRTSRELLRLCESRHEAGTASKAEVAQARKQYRELRKQCREAADGALEFERSLVVLAGLGAGSRLRPSDHPSLTRERPAWDAALREAISRRPELQMARKDVSASSVKLHAEETFGVVLEIFTPLRLKRKPVRALQSQLARHSEVLEDQEGKAQNFLELYYCRLSLNYKQIQSTRAQREALGEMLVARKVQYAAGRCSLAALLDAQRACADAQGAEYAAIGMYNNARAGFVYGKGATLDRHHMVLVPR